MSSAGKGDRRRPYDKERWDDGWERTFGSEDEPTENPCQVPEADNEEAL